LEAERAVRTELLRVGSFRQVLLEEYQEGTKEAEPSIRLLLLFTSLLKLREQARAAYLLSGEVFVEEILAISRTMAELAINAAYLQEAGDEEIERYQHFDTQSLYKHSTKLKTHITVQLSQKDQVKIDEAVAFARTSTNRKDNDPTWSIRTLFQRAEFIDDRSKLSLMVTLILTVYASGHQAVHATNSSLQPFYSALKTGTVPQTEERLEALSLALAGVNFVLHVFGLFVNSLLHLDLEPDLIQTGRLIASR
jgi:hypothetical protein